MASPARSLSSHVSCSAIAPKCSPTPDQLAHGMCNNSSPKCNHPTEYMERRDLSGNRALTVDASSAEASCAFGRPGGEPPDHEGASASPRYPGGPMSAVPPRNHSKSPWNSADFSAALEDIPQDLHYSMDRFLDAETYRLEEDSGSLQILHDIEQKMASNLNAARRYMDQMKEDEALRLIGSAHAQNTQTVENEDVELAMAPLPAVSDPAEAGKAQSSESKE